MTRSLLGQYPLKLHAQNFTYSTGEQWQTERERDVLFKTTSSLSLSLSLTHTHTHTHAPTLACTRARTQSVQNNRVSEQQLLRRCLEVTFSTFSLATLQTVPVPRDAGVQGAAGGRDAVPDQILVLCFVSLSPTP